MGKKSHTFEIKIFMPKEAHGKVLCGGFSSRSEAKDYIRDNEDELNYYRKQGYTWYSINREEKCQTICEIL